ncbi:GNAT family N-acetyltransferase [Octadecabacter sp. G9-8]|uniref:GNAT family N-acetyltransferase n=1 Tax=Octadecabacter dasysiphoniae TaxID=2909341 RepID=A0ABS9CU45_9RHOB|nr:GNAT family protein [Octadecabacter dasysiphoniae]MCF2870770.1 GNAT family N-acetyltransferase [Octadecabacter dasysiphoniae]
MIDPHNRPVLGNDILRLRAPVAADVAARFALGRSAEILRGYGVDATSLGPYTLAETEAWVEEHLRKDHHFIIEHGGALVGAVFLHSVDGTDRRATIAIGLVDEAKLGQGIGTAAMRLMLTHAFGTLGLHRIGLHVMADNERAIACYRKLGFVEEGRTRESARVGNVWQDDLVMGILAREFLT